MNVHQASTVPRFGFGKKRKIRVPQYMHSDQRDHDRIKKVVRYPHSHPITSNNHNIDSHSDQPSSSEEESSEGSDFDEWKDESDGSDSDSVTSYETIQEGKHDKVGIDEMEEVDLEELSRMRFTSVQKLRTSWERIIRQYGNKRLQKGEKVKNIISQRNQHISIPISLHNRSWRPAHSVVPPLTRFKGSAGFMIAPEWQILSSEEDEEKSFGDDEEDDEDVIDFEAKDWEKKAQNSSYFSQSDENQRTFKASRGRPKPSRSTFESIKRAKSKQTLIEVKKVIDLTGATSDEDQDDHECMRTKQHIGEAFQIEKPTIERTNEKARSPSSKTFMDSHTHHSNSMGNPEGTARNALEIKKNAMNETSRNQTTLQSDNIVKPFPIHPQDKFNFEDKFNIEPESGSEDVYEGCGRDVFDDRFDSEIQLEYNNLIEATLSPKHDHESLKGRKRNYIETLNDEILPLSNINHDDSVPKRQRKNEDQVRMTDKMMKKSDEEFNRSISTCNKVSIDEIQQNMSKVKQIFPKKRFSRSETRQPRQKIMTNFMSSSKPNRHLSSSQCKGRNECKKSFCLICGSFKGLGNEILI